MKNDAIDFVVTWGHVPVIESRKCKFICLSDVSTEESFERDKNAINASFEKVFPMRCSFERKE